MLFDHFRFHILIFISFSCTIIAVEEITDDQIINDYLYPSNNTADNNSSSTILPETTTVATTTTTVATDSEPCICVPYYLCDIENGTIIQDGSAHDTSYGLIVGIGLIDPRVNPLDHPNSENKPQCKNSFDICCKQIKSNNSTNGIIIEPKVESPGSNNTTSLSENPPNALPVFKHSVCGKRNAAGIGLRISGPDTQTQFGEFPWMTAVLKIDKNGKTNQVTNVFICGGSLIHPKVVLTAAHCIYGKPKSKLKIRFGEWDTHSASEIYPYEDRSVADVVIHRDFQAGSLYNDIALLILDESITFAPNIDTVCLSPTNFDLKGKKCFVSGFGKDAFGQKGNYQTVMKKVELPIVDNSKCQDELRKTRLGEAFKLHNSFICAGGDAGQDTCQGDGGSPLVCQFPNSPYYVQYGIVAWGIGCGGDGTPGVYVNVPKFLPWITEQFTTYHLETSYYKSLF